MIEQLMRMWQRARKEPETPAVPTLTPLTRKARQSVPGGRVRVTRFPFRLGRDAQIGLRRKRLCCLERPGGNMLPDNDVFLANVGRVRFISREHFQIERNANGTYALVDRGSACGTMVDGVTVGAGDEGGRHPLRNGSVIAVGGRSSPFIFRFDMPSPPRAEPQAVVQRVRVEEREGWRIAGPAPAWAFAAFANARAS
jgi:hypothetical protein